MHMALLIVMIVGLPSLFDRTPEHEPMVMTVEVLPVTARSNVPNKSEAKPVEKELPKEKTQKEQPKPAQQEKSEAKTAAKQEVKQEEKPKESVAKKEVKKEEKKEEKPKEVAKTEDKKKDKAKQQDELDALLKDLSATENNRQAEEEVKETAVDEVGKTSKDEDYDPTVEIGLSVKDSIKQQIQKNWSVPAGARDVQNMTVTIAFSLDRGGNITGIDIKANQSRYNSDPFYRAFVESAARAVRISSPLQGLPADKYRGWSKMELVFDPRDALY